MIFLAKKEILTQIDLQIPISSGLSGWKPDLLLKTIPSIPTLVFGDSRVRVRVKVCILSIPHSTTHRAQKGARTADSERHLTFFTGKILNKARQCQPSDSDSQLIFNLDRPFFENPEVADSRYRITGEYIIGTHTVTLQ